MTAQASGNFLPASNGMLSKLRDVPGYELAVRAVGSAWFLLLAIMTTRTLFGDTEGAGRAALNPSGWSEWLSRLCIALYYVTLWVLIIARPKPTARSSSIWPSFVAFLGSYLPWSIPFLTDAANNPGWLHVVSAILLFVGSALTIVVVLYLGRSFSIVPQARKLVRSGPYSLIRHPLYLAEEVAVLGAVLHYLSPGTVVLFFVHCALQVRRMLYEESLLGQIFPDYAEYAVSTARIIPCLW